MELAYQLKIDVRKREEEIVELDTEVKIKVNQLSYITSYITITVDIQYLGARVYSATGATN